MSQKKKIILHGHLAEKYPHEITVEADTVAEALRSLSTIPELQPPSGTPWPVTVRNVSNEIALFSETSLEEIHVYPRTGGAKKGGLMQVLLGVVLVAVAVINPVGAMGLLGQVGVTQGMLFTAGAMMALGGVLQMLMPTPQGMEGQNGDSSKYLSASGNTVQIGTRITLAYGNNRIGGHYLSFDVDAVDWAGEDTEEGEVSLVGNNVFVEHDKTPVPTVPVQPVFNSPVTGPSNVPVSAWSAAV